MFKNCSGDEVGILKKVGDLLSPNDPELIEKTLTRLSEQDTWNDVFSTKLIELLDKIDLIKKEIRERLRNADERLGKAESVTQLESALLEKLAKYGDASRRLELAEAAQERASSLAADARNRLDTATAALDEARKLAFHARNLADDANAKLCSSRDAELKAVRLSRQTVRCATAAVALSWIAMVWTAWFVFRVEPVFWGACSLSVVIAVVSIFVLRGTQDEA